MENSSWRAFWHTLTRYQRDRVNPALGLRNALGVALPLLMGVVTGAASMALAIATGALNVSFSDSTDAYRRRAGRMIMASFIVAAAVTTGSFIATHGSVRVPLLGLWAFVAGLLVAVGTAEADIGLISLVTLIVFSVERASGGRAVPAGLLALTGGLFQTLLSTAAWPLRASVPERRALADLYLALGAADISFTATEPPPASEESSHAQQALADVVGSQSVERHRYRYLLNQAERIRLSLLTVRRLRARLLRTPQGEAWGEAIGSALEATSRVLRSVGESLRSGTPMRGVGEDMHRVEALAEEFRALNSQDEIVAAMVRDARFQMEALAGQLRAAIQVAVSTTPAGWMAQQREERRQSWRLRALGTLATLRANLSLRSAAFRHAVRMAVCVSLGDLAARELGLQRSYWVPMTIALVLKPDFAATFSRGVLRFGGTIAGLIIATLLFHALPPGHLMMVFWVAVFTFLLRTFGAANYGIVAITVTGLVVMLFALAGLAPDEFISARAIDTVTGGALALLVFRLWPTWERTHISESLASMLDAYRLYFREVRKSASQPARRELEETRLAGRLARSNLEAALGRLSAEPGTTDESLSQIRAIMATSHRAVHAMMALEATLRHGVKPGRAFDVFCNDVELTLYFLAQLLRGSKVDDLPDLREDYHAVVHSGEARYGLLGVEADRLTNSLNTLREEIQAWAAQGKA